MRADRLLSIVLLLQVHRRLTARDLAERLEVSERTIYRDIDALSTAGVPVYTERGPHGGVCLPEEYRARLPGLSEVEIQSLFVGAPAQLMADLGLAQASERALLKLLAALPPVARRCAEDARQRIHVDPVGWLRSADSVPYLSVLQDGVWQERKVRMTYRRSDGSTSERLVDPLGLVAKGSVWYLVAAVEGAPRTYRVSRVQDAALSDEPCVRPRDFDLVAYWERSRADFEANLPYFMARVRTSPGVLQRLRFGGVFARVEEVGPAGSDGWSTALVRFDTEDEACAFILGYGPGVEALEPESLRAAVVERAQRVIAVYETDPVGATTRG